MKKKKRRKKEMPMHIEVPLPPILDCHCEEVLRRGNPFTIFHRAIYYVSFGNSKQNLIKRYKFLQDYSLLIILYLQLSALLKGCYCGYCSQNTSEKIGTKQKIVFLSVCIQTPNRTV